LYRILDLEHILVTMLVADPSLETTLVPEITQAYIMDQQIIQAITQAHSRVILVDHFLAQQYKQLKKQCHLLSYG